MPLMRGRVTDDQLTRLAADAKALPLSYGELGATRNEEGPSGYRHDHHSIDIGGRDDFERAAEGLRRWAAHRGANAKVVPDDAPIAPGETLLVVLTLPFITAVAPCRIVYVTEEPDRFGFAYGTLVGHPEQGEESFHVVRDAGGTRFEIAVFSRPADPIVRMTAPVARQLQLRTTGRYLRGLQSFVRAASRSASGLGGPETDLEL